MKNLFDWKDEKVTEKAFSKGLLVSGFCILLCIVLLCSLTYAWFVSEKKSTNNILLAGSFDLTVSVSKFGTEFPVVPDANQDGVLTCNLPEAGSYTVRLKLKDGSSAKGHCIVKVGNDSDRHTDAIVSGALVQNKANASDFDFTFIIDVTESKIVTFLPRWGMVVTPDIENGGVYPSSKSSNNP